MTAVSDSAPPALDELEITVFGRGYGESVLCHLGDSRWLLVDCFNNVPSGRPVALDYLDDLGGPDARIVAVVATHFDNDHILGMGEVLRSHRPAQVWIPAALRAPEVIKFAYAHDDAMKGAEDSPSGVEAFVDIMQETRDGSRRWGIVGREVETGAEAKVRLLAPSDETVSDGFLGLAGLAPGFGEVTSVKANATSIVVWLSWDGREALLGADLEKGAKGWGAVLRAKPLGGARAQFLKVPHHGSPDADEPRLWSELCVDEPHFALTRFTKSVTARPSRDDRERLRGRPGTGWVVGAPGEKQVAAMSPEELHAESETIDGFWFTDGPVGSVRYRCPRGGVWTVEPTGAVTPA